MITAEDLAQWEDEARRAIHTCDTDDRIERLIQEVRAERDATDAYRAEMELLREQSGRADRSVSMAEAGRAGNPRSHGLGPAGCSPGPPPSSPYRRLKIVLTIR
jgi:hypothetical protein